MVHEFAHLKLKHIKLIAGNLFIKSTEPQQEEQAWIFSQIFMGLVFGDYAFRVRNAKKVDPATGLIMLNSTGDEINRNLPDDTVVALV